MIMPTLLMRCSTFFLNSSATANSALIPGFQDAARIISDQEFVAILPKIRLPDCVTIVANDISALPEIYEKAGRIRTQIEMLVATSNNFTAPAKYFTKAIKIDEKYDILVSFMDKQRAHTIVNGRAKRVVLRAGYVKQPPYIMSSSGESGEIFGIDVDIMNAVGRRIGCAVEFVPMAGFGELLVKIAGKQTDVVLNQMNFLHPRLQMGLDPSPSLISRKFHFQYRYPVPIDNFNTITSTFTSTVWTATIASALTMLLTFATIRRFSSSNRSLLHFDDVFLTAAPLLKKSLPPSLFQTRQGNSDMLAMISWFLFGSVLSHAFRSNLLSSLAKREFEKFPNTVEDVLALKKGVYLFDHPVLISSFADSAVEGFRRIHSEGVVKRGGLYKSPILPEDVKEKILQGEAVMVWQDDGMAPYNDVLTQGSQDLFGGHGGYYFPLKLQLKPQIDLALMILQETGIIKETTGRHNWSLSLKRREALRRTVHEKETVIGAVHAFPSFVVFLAGVALSTVSMIAEKCKFGKG